MSLTIARRAVEELVEDRGHLVDTVEEYEMAALPCDVQLGAGDQPGEEAGVG
jgi:hypothetical protein